MIKNLILFLLFFGIISIFFGFHFLVENPLEEGNTLVFLLLAGSIFSLFIGWLFPENSQKSMQKKILFFSGLISVVSAFSFVFIDNAHNDYYRYIWDGKASEISEETGKNVYEVTPRETYKFVSKRENIEARSTVSLRDNFFAQTGFHDYYTTYPPTLQLVFWASSEISGYNFFWYSEPPQFPKGQERGLKFIFFLFYLGTLFLVWKIFSQNPQTKKWIPTFFLSPLLMWEGVAAGHSEIVFVFFLFLTLFFFQREKYFCTGVSLSALVWVKFFPAVLGMIFLWEIWRRGRIISAPTENLKNIFLFIFGGIASTVLLWLPFLPFDPENFLDALKLYASEWRMFPLFFDIMEDDFSMRVAQIIQIFLVLGAIIWGIWKKNSVEKNIFWTLFVYLLFSPAVFSWYFLWFLPLGIFVLAPQKKYFLLTALFLTPPLQYFYTVFDPEKNIFYYQDNGLDISQKIFFWGMLFVSLMITFFIFLWKKYGKKVY